MIPGGFVHDAGGLRQLRVALGDALAELESIAEELRREAAEVRADVEHERARLLAERERAEAAARESLQADPARRVLQRRVDDGSTSWRAVLSGADDHWSARAVRAELVSDARATIAAIEAEDSDPGARRAHAVRTNDEERP